MLLVEAVRSLQDRVLDDLNIAHDYYTNSHTAWKMVREFIDAGTNFSIQSFATGSRMPAGDFASKGEFYVREQLAEATFQQFISIFESYFFDLLRLWLLAYPRSLVARQVDFKTVLDAQDKDAITLLVVNRELNEVLYNRPAGWFTYLAERLNIGCPTPDEIERIAEAKATRDVLVHNRGIASKIYLSKAGTLARCQDGQRLGISQDYHRQTWELLRKVISDISNAAIARIT